MTSAADVDRSAALGADFFGFIVYPKSPRALSLESAAQLASRVPEEKRVIVDVATAPEALEAYRQAGFGRFQIHAPMPLDPATLAAWSRVVGADRLWLAPRLAPTDGFPASALQFAETILVDTYAPGRIGGTGRIGDWGQFAALRAAYPETRFVLAGGLTPSNIGAAICRTGATQVDVNSGVETAPGKKDPEKLEALFRVLKSENQGGTRA